MRALLVPILLVLPLALGIAVAGPCDSEGWPALGRIEISPTHDPTRTYYVDDRSVVFANGLWIYEETNGVYFGGDVTKDLQRGNISDILFDPDACACDPDACQDPRPDGTVPDRDIF